MDSFCAVIRPGRIKLDLTWRQLAVHFRDEQHRQISAPYVNEREHNLGKPPHPHLIGQVAGPLQIQSTHSALQRVARLPAYLTRWPLRV